jgi:hypothetical protein
MRSCILRIKRTERGLREERRGLAESDLLRESEARTGDQGGD